jgi:hypothetical protein
MFKKVEALESQLAETSAALQAALTKVRHTIAFEIGHVTCL